MASYRVVIKESAEAEFRAVPFPFRRQINQRIYKLKGDPRPEDSERLGEEEFYRIRVAGWRVLYEVDDEQAEVTILAIVAGE